MTATEKSIEFDLCDMHGQTLVARQSVNFRAQTVVLDLAVSMGGKSYTIASLSPAMARDLAEKLGIWADLHEAGEAPMADVALARSGTKK